MSDSAVPHQSPNADLTPSLVGSLVAIVDDDDALRDALEVLISAAGWRAQCYESGEAFLDSIRDHDFGCALVDVRLPGIDGITVFRRLIELGLRLPVVILTGHGDIPMAVDALKAGAMDFIEKPFDPDRLLNSLHQALSREATERANHAATISFSRMVGSLTPRELEVMELMVLGLPNKLIAAKLTISPRTVEIYRARVMEKMAVRSLAELVRLTVSARP